MAFPTFVGHGGAVQESTGTLTVVNSASATNGDYELLIIETMNEAATLTTTGGFTAFTGDLGSGAGIYPSPNATATLATRLTHLRQSSRSDHERPRQPRHRQHLHVPQVLGYVVGAQRCALGYAGHWLAGEHPGRRHHLCLHDWPHH
jgi:hypothetical protein